MWRELTKRMSGNLSTMEFLSLFAKHKSGVENLCFEAIMSSSVFPCILAHLPLVHPSFPLSLSLPVIGLLETALLIVISGGASALALSLPWLMFSGSYLNQHQSFIGAQTVHVGGTSSGIMCVHCVQCMCMQVCTYICICVCIYIMCVLACMIV